MHAQMHSPLLLQPWEGQDKGLNSRRTSQWMGHETNAWNFWHSLALPNVIGHSVYYFYDTEEPLLQTLWGSTTETAVQERAKTPSIIIKENSKLLWVGEHKKMLPCCTGIGTAAGTCWQHTSHFL